MISEIMERRIGRVGGGVLRWSLVVFFIGLGLYKFTAQEAANVTVLMAHSPVLFWVNPLLGIRGGSDFIGVIEILLGTSIACRHLKPLLSAYGSLATSVALLITLSFLFTTPGLTSIHAGFLVKDLTLFGAALWTSAEAFSAAREAPDRQAGRRSKKTSSRFDAAQSLPASEELAKLTSLQHPDRDTRYDEAGAENSTESSLWRLATERDFDRILDMNERLNVEDPSEAIPFDGTMMKRTLSEISLNPIRGAVAVLELGGRQCGYALLISFWSNEFGGETCAIDELYVDPEYRGRGFATQLIQGLAGGNSPVWPRRAVMISVEAYRSNPRAKALYERLGFEASPNHLLTLVLADRKAESLLK